MRKWFFISVICTLVLWVLYVGGSHMYFSGVFDTKFDREQLNDNFLKNEKTFNSLISLFREKTANVDGYTVALGVNRNNRISLNLYPVVIDPANKILGVDDVEIGAVKLDSILRVLNWSKVLLIEFKDKLKQVGCNWIRTTQIYGSPVDIYPSQNGWGSYSYLFFKEPVDSVIREIHGEPLGGSGLGNRAFLEYSSAL